MFVRISLFTEGFTPSGRYPITVKISKKTVFEMNV